MSETEENVNMETQSMDEATHEDVNLEAPVATSNVDTETAPEVAPVVAPVVAPETAPETADEDVLDQVFGNAEKVCCGFQRKVTPEAPDVEPTMDVEAGNTMDTRAEKALFDESPDDDFAMDDYEESQASALERNSSKVKEAVEIQAHFDGDEDGLTITSDIGNDVSTLGASGFMDGKDNIYRRRRLGCILCILATLLILLVVLLVTVVDRNNGNSNDLTAEAGLVAGASTSAPVVETPATTAPDVLDFNNSTIPEEDEEETESPTSTPCVASIQVTKTCFQYFQDDIVVGFNICEPLDGDWIGFYPEGEDPSNLGDPEFEWNYSCGDKDCVGADARGSVNMNRFMPPGRFQAFLFSHQGDEAPYSAVAVSEAFQVSARGC